MRWRLPESTRWLDEGGLKRSESQTPPWPVSLTLRVVSEREASGLWLIESKCVISWEEQEYPRQADVLYSQHQERKSFIPQKKQEHKMNNRDQIIRRYICSLLNLHPQRYLDSPSDTMSPSKDTNPLIFWPTWCILNVFWLAWPEACSPPTWFNNNLSTSPFAYAIVIKLWNADEQWFALLLQDALLRLTAVTGCENLYDHKMTMTIIASFLSFLLFL